VCVVENNQWAYSTPVKRQVPIRNLAERAKSYGIASAIVDGNDVLAVYQAAKDAVERCRAGDGPVMIEAKTHRMRGHAQHDPAEYVPKAMVEYWTAQDPIGRYEKYLTNAGLWNEKKKAEIDARIERELDEDQKFAEESPLPPAELAEQGVFCDGCHEIKARWERPVEEVTPPRCSIEMDGWTVEDFGQLENIETEKMESVAVSKLAPSDQRSENVSGDAKSGVRSGGQKNTGAKSPARHPLRKGKN
jgi:hypothetical protein